MLKYKLTDQKHQTYNETQWGPNVIHETNGEGKICGPGWLHYYHSPLLAVFLNPIHGHIKNPVLWECEAEGQHLDDKGLKGGCTKLTTIKIIDLPEVTSTQRIAFGILCAKEVCKDEVWNNWADKWLSGEDRSKEAADAAYVAASRVVVAAVDAAVSAAANDLQSLAEKAMRY